MSHGITFHDEYQRNILENFGCGVWVKDGFVYSNYSHDNGKSLEDSIKRNAYFKFELEIYGL